MSMKTEGGGGRRTVGVGVQEDDLYNIYLKSLRHEKARNGTIPRSFCSGGLHGAVCAC